MLEKLKRFFIKQPPQPTRYDISAAGVGGFVEAFSLKEACLEFRKKYGMKSDFIGPYYIVVMDDGYFKVDYVCLFQP